ncbi:protein FAR1-RELATED SEQUENCE 5-like isoform X2 [Lotus japonicus]|uniref:protein FAR1-RELATED SEQUENCE 5-like isoform X2 n=1 Tax=Lotus japonicus TaxID=34305 RepID=UPI002586B5CE|nr:protein FAR1-RELATED SEQUENCE 5-like isoform X2 [Lotus japonicus]
MKLRCSVFGSPRLSLPVSKCYFGPLLLQVFFFVQFFVGVFIFNCFLSCADCKPKLGMVFDSREDAWMFWLNYGKKVGFGVRREYCHTKKDGSVSSCRFVCCKEDVRKVDKQYYKIVNPRPETRTNCQVRLGLKQKDGKLVVHDFLEEHNHILHLQETSHMLPSQRKVLEVQSHQIELADDAGLQQKKSFELMSKQVGGRSNLGYTRLDQKNYLRKKKAKKFVTWGSWLYIAILSEKVS